MKRYLSVGLGTLGLMVSGLIAATPAQAGSNTPGCVIAGEWSRTHLSDTKPMVQDEFDTSGWLIDSWRSGFNGQLLDEKRGYGSCRYPGDDIVVWYDDYSHGSTSRGGQMRVYWGKWTHYCVDYDSYYNYCYDPGWYGYGYTQSLRLRY